MYNRKKSLTHTFINYRQQSIRYREAELRDTRKNDFILSLTLDEKYPSMFLSARRA